MSILYINTVYTVCRYTGIYTVMYENREYNILYVTTSISTGTGIYLIYNLYNLPCTSYSIYRYNRYSYISYISYYTNTYLSFIIQ